MSNFEHFLSTKKVYLKKLTKKIIFNELLYNCISSTVIYIKKPSIWWPEKYFSHDKMQFFGIFRNYEIKYCFWSFGNTIKIMALIGGRVLTMFRIRIDVSGTRSISINNISLFSKHIFSWNEFIFKLFSKHLLSHTLSQITTAV